MEAFVFPFLFLEASLALGAINGYGEKQKSYAFYHTKLRMLLALEQKKKE